MTQPSKSVLWGWSTRDLLITVVIGLAFGLLLVPATYAYVALQTFGILARGAAGGLYFLPAAFAAYVMRKPGAIFLVSLVGGLAAMPFTPSGLIVLVISALTGLLGELAAWIITRHRYYSLTRMLLMGVATGLFEYLLLLAGLRTTQVEWWVALLAALISAVAFAVCALLSKLLADAVARTGVLANTALGRTSEHV